MFTITAKSKKFFLSILTFTLALTFATASYTESLSPSCSSPTRLLLDETWRGSAGDAGAVACFQVDVPEPGIVSFDLSAPGSAESRPVLSVRAEDGGKLDRPLWRTPTNAVFKAASPGTLVVLVRSEDPLAELAPYKLRTGFAAFESPLAAEKAEDDGEAEPDGYPKSLCVLTKAEDDGEAEPDGYPKSSHSCSKLPRWNVLLAETCRRGELDDHGDTFACATPLDRDRVVRGEIGNGRGDDEDLFVFELTRLTTVEIVSSGPTDTLGELYDRFGHRLASDDDGAGDGNFRMVRALSPGTYFVRLQASGTAAGSYTLTLGE